MRLFGFQCDGCGAKSRDRPGKWIEITTMRVDSMGEWSNLSALRSDGLHYCSPECLASAIPKWEISKGRIGSRF